MPSLLSSALETGTLLFYRFASNLVVQKAFKRGFPDHLEDKKKEIKAEYTVWGEGEKLTLKDVLNKECNIHGIFQHSS